jgi:hypothetical protein
MDIQSSVFKHRMKDIIDSIVVEFAMKGKIHLTYYRTAAKNMFGIKLID